MNAFINNALVFSFGAQFRRNVLRNWMLTGFIALTYVIQLFFMFSPPNSITIAMHVFTEQCMPVPESWRAWPQCKHVLGSPIPQLSRFCA